MQSTPSVMTTKIRRLPQTNEWVVRVYIDGKRYPDGDYFTEWKDDAIATAAAIVATYTATHE